MTACFAGKNGRPLTHGECARTRVRNSYPALEAYFACLYYAALRPAEARHLRVKDCVLPKSGWGQLILVGSTPDSNGAWTDSGQANEDRQLKHRGVSDTRPVPASPELVEILRQHIATFPTSPGGRLFVTRIGRAGVPLPPPFNKPLRMGTAYRAWDTARAAAFTDAEYASPLAKRPYDLRHAALSTWLNAVDGRFWPITAGTRRRAPDRRFRRSGALSARGGR